MTTANECSRLLAQQAEAVCRYLLPRGKRVGQEWCIGNIDGVAGESLKVHLEGSKSGVWSDFSEGTRGDLLTLWSLKRNLSLSEALKEATLYLGISTHKFDPPRSFNFAKPDQKKWQAASRNSPVFNYLTQTRKLSAETVDAFSIREDGRTIIFPYIQDNVVLQNKYIKIDRDENGKKITWTDRNCQPCLFGWQAISANTRSIAIAEGEIDAMTLHQYGISSLSVPFGGGKGAKHKWVEFEFDRLAIFDEIFLVFDDDPAGHQAIADLIGRLGRHRCRIVKLAHKDPNACLQAGMSKEEIMQCFSAAATLDPQELKQASSLVDRVINEFYPAEGSIIGYDPPWQKFKGKVLFRPAELSIWTGINGHGKSQFIGQTILSMMKQGARVCVASLELKPQKLLMRLARQAGGTQTPTDGYIRAIHEWYNDRLWIFDLVGTAKADRLLDVFLYARQKYGIDVFVIDSFLKLDIAEDDYKAQKSVLEKLCDFKNEHDCQIHLVVHPRKPSSETEVPCKLDTKGTGAITDLADNCFSVWRNKAKEELKRKQESGCELTPKELNDVKKPDCFWICDKQRNGDWEGRAGLWFDPRSFQYLTHEGQQPIRYVPYSSIQPINTCYNVSQTQD